MSMAKHIVTTSVNLSSLPEQDGQIIFTSDTKKLYIDVNTNRHNVGDIIFLDYIINRPIAGLSDKLYYVIDSNTLYKFTSDGKWVALNDTSDISQAITNIQTRLDTLEDDVSTLKNKVFVKSIYELPTIGEANTIYMNINENISYFWDDTQLKYIILSNNWKNIEIIDCGSAFL